MRGKLLVLFWIGCALANICIFINREHFSFTKQSAYYQLYPSYKDVSLASFKVRADSSLSLVLNNKPPANTVWKVKKNQQQFLQNVGESPLLPLTEGVSHFIVSSPSFKDSLPLTIEFFSKNYFARQGKTAPSRITVFESVLLNENNDLAKWKQNKIEASADELKSIQNILRDSIKIKQGENSASSARKIASYLCYKISAAKGDPSDKTFALSTFQQYLAACRGQHIDCGIYAEIFSLFATQAGITNRMVEMRHNYGTFDFDIHVFNEYFIAEQKKWVALDLLFNNIAYVDQAGNLLNAVQVKNNSQFNNATTVLHSALVNDSIVSTPFSALPTLFFNFYAMDRDIFFYYQTDLTNVYSLKEKIKRYISKDVWYESYSDVWVVDNKSFYIKILLLSTWAGLSFLIMILLMVKYFRARRTM